MADVSRRFLLRPFLGRRSEPPRPSFSLTAYYEARPQAVAAQAVEIPRREGLPVMPASTRGTGVVAPPAASGAYTVRVRPEGCLALTSFCSVCSERCPDQAISLVEGRPEVNRAGCTGCGVCLDVCPSPAAALEVLPPLKENPA